MAESIATQAIVNHTVIQVATTVVMVLRDADEGPRSGASTPSLREEQRQRDGGPALKQPSFNWNVTDKYVELQNFVMEVKDILETKKL